VAVNRYRPLVVVTVLVVSLFVGTAVTAGQTDDPRRTDGVLAQQVSATGSPAVAITDVTVSPEEPIAGNTFQVQATITNYEGATAGFDISSVYVDKPGGRSYVASDVGTLTPGALTTVTVPVSIDSEGQYTLSVEASGIETDGGGVVSTSQPVLVRVVDEQRPRANLAGSDWGAGSETTAELTIVNGGADPIRNLEVTLDSETVTVDNPTRVRASLDAESNVTYRFDVTPAETGRHRITADLQYTDPAGNDKTVTETQAISVAERDPPLSLAVSAERVGPSGRTTFDVTAVNERQTAITGLELQFESQDGQMVDSRAVVPSLQSGNETMTSLEVREVGAGPHDLAVRASYTTARGEQESFTEPLRTTVEAVSAPGNVSLSGLQMRGSGTGVSVSGSMSNPGTTDISGVEISVADGEMVGPAPSQSSFFVGNVTSSDFTSFQVNAQLRTQTNRTVTIPLRVSYVVDGVQQERFIEVEYDPQASPAAPAGGGQQGEESPQRGGGLPLALIGVALVVAGGVALFGWRRYRG